MHVNPNISLPSTFRPWRRSTYDPARDPAALMERYEAGELASAETVGAEEDEESMFITDVRLSRRRRLICCAGITGLLLLALITIAVQDSKKSTDTSDSTHAPPSSSSSSSSPPQSVGFPKDYVKAPSNLSDLCDEHRIAVDDACRDACGVASCCFDDVLNDCYEDATDMCMEYAPCEALYLGSVDGSQSENKGEVVGKGGVVQKTGSDWPDRITPQPPTNLEAICSMKKDQDALAQCEMACIEGRCCWSTDPSSNCFTAAEETCRGYVSCVEAFGLNFGQTHIATNSQKAPDSNELAKAIDEACSSPLVSPDKRKMCNSLCKKGSCCFDDGTEVGCKDEEWCVDYNSCFVLYNENASGQGINEFVAQDVKLACSGLDPVTGMTECQAVCADGACCFDSGGESCEEEEWCASYKGCAVLYSGAVNGIIASQQQQVEEKKETADYISKVCASKTPVDMVECRSVCSQGSCCFKRDGDTGSCAAEEWCADYMGCGDFMEKGNEDLAATTLEKDNGLSVVMETVDIKCTSNHPEDLADCMVACARGACCFHDDKGSCAEETEKCQYYKNCKVLYEGTSGNDGYVNPDEEEEMWQNQDGQLSTGFLGVGGPETETKGIMFDVESMSVNKRVAIDAFDINMEKKRKNSVQVYTRLGSHKGYEDNAESWIDLGAYAVQGEGQGNPTAIVLKEPYQLPPRGQKQAFYIVQLNDDDIETFDMKSSDTTHEHVKDDNIKIYVGTSMNGAAFEARNEEGIGFSGTIWYVLTSGSAVIETAKASSSGSKSLSACEQHEKELSTGFKGTGGERTEMEGIMFDVENTLKEGEIVIERMLVNIEKTGMHRIQAFTRPGSHVGFEDSASGWRDLGQHRVNGKGQDRPSLMELNSKVVVGASGRTAFFIYQLDDDDIQTFDRSGLGVGSLDMDGGELNVYVGTGKKGGFFGKSLPGLGFSGTLFYCSSDQREEKAALEGNT